MRRRVLLRNAAAATAVGLAAGCIDDTNPGAAGDESDGDDTDGEETDTGTPTDEGGTGGDDESTEGDDGDAAGEEDNVTEPEDEGGDTDDSHPDDDHENSSSSGDSAYGEAGETPGGRYSLSTPGGECGDENDATVSFDDRTVRLEGSIAASNPCHRVTIAAAEFTDSTTYEVTVGVESTTDEGEACTSCIATVPYEAEFEFEDRTPETVLVYHDSAFEQVEVARADREE